MKKLDSETTKVADVMSDSLQASPLLSSKIITWKGIEVEQYHNEPAEIEPFISSEHLITINLGDPLKVFQSKQFIKREKILETGEITVTPANVESAWRWMQPSDVLHIAISPDLIKEIADDSPRLNSNELEIISNFGTLDPLVYQLGASLKNDLESGAPTGRLYGESLGTAIAAHLLYQYAAEKNFPKQFTGGLSGNKLRLVLDYINDNLDQDIRLADLAGLAQMSSFHFARKFRQTTGKSPHQYLTDQRVARAKELLSKSEISLAEIAYTLGFSSQSHFTNAFRRHTSTTPLTYRLRS